MCRRESIQRLGLISPRVQLLHLSHHLIRLTYHQAIDTTTSLRISVHQSAHFIHSLQYFINHAIYRAQDFGRRFLHVRSCADHRHATTATNIIENHSPKLNTSAFVALQAVG
jgi:hypothetical protein